MINLRILFTEEFSTTKLFIYIASGIGFLAVAIVLGITCKKFLNKRSREDKFRRPYDEPRVYRAGRSLSGENDDEDDEEDNTLAK